MSARRAEALDYPGLVRELFPRLSGGIRWGLDRTQRLLDAVGNPERAWRAIHIAGTNGKGTAAAVAEAVLRAAGLRTGLYTSPHLTSFRERVRIDGRLIEEVALLESARALWPHIEREAPSFFEATTAIAFDAFARAHVDVAVVEVGLGGRLDATNVIAPDVTVVTNVAVDHVEFLGPDPVGIAREKAGIAKPGVPFLVGEEDPSMLSVLVDGARERGAIVHRLPPDEPELLDWDSDGTRFRLATRWGMLEARLPLAGPQQARNAALALRALELSPLHERVTLDAARRGVEATRWPGRFQIERVDGRTWIFDVAHNPSSIQRLAATVLESRVARPLAVLLGVMGDKDWTAMLASLSAIADRIVLTRPEHAPAGRAWDPAAAAAALPPGRAEVVPLLGDAVQAVRAAGDATVLVTGSFHTVGEAMIRLGIDPGWAPDPVVDVALQR
ncbi:MAG TPA: Mur ligase family protein [Longimicrobiales bacterium]|nr:Mur ligase family protein [Longimicrobiales bacterium]